MKRRLYNLFHLTLYFVLGGLKTEFYRNDLKLIRWVDAEAFDALQEQAKMEKFIALAGLDQ